MTRIAELDVEIEAKRAQQRRIEAEMERMDPDHYADLDAAAYAIDDLADEIYALICERSDLQHGDYERDNARDRAYGRWAT